MNELKEIEVDEVSLVDAGANPQADILFFKRKEEKLMAKTEKTAEVVKQEEIITPVEVEKVDTEKDELQKRVAELEKILAEREAADKAELEKAAAEKIAADNAEVAALLKRVENRLEEHIEKAETNELIKIASKYEILGEKADELASVLKKAKGSDLYDKIINNLDRELAIVEKQGVFEEIGKRGRDDGGSVDELAKRFQAEDKLSWREALDKAFIAKGVTE